MKAVYFLVLLVSLLLVVDVDAGWKFWKKNKDEPTSTVSPVSSSTTAVSTSAAPAKATTQGPKNTANRGIAAAADPALAIGVGNVGGKIREDARNQPRKPNPGTEVGLDIGPPIPNEKSRYKPIPDYDFPPGIRKDSDREKPKVPEQGPALAPNHGNRPTSLPGSSSGQQPAVIPGTRPESTHGIPNGQHSPAGGSRPDSNHGIPSGQHSPAAGAKPTAHTPVPAPSPTPIARPTPAPQPRPGPGVPQSKPGPNTGTRSWSDVASGGNHQGPPVPAPRPGQHPYDHPQSGSGGQSGRPGINTGAAIGGAASGAALAGAAAATGNSGKVFSSNPTYSKGNLVTDEDLQKLSEALFAKDVNNANKYITLNLQKTTSGNSAKDEASQPLLQVKPEALQLPTIQKVLTIYDNYKLDTREGEYISPAQRQEESILVDTFLSTNLMSAAMRFLADKGFVKKDYYEYKDTLRTLWFNLYSRGEGKISSSGFEHVFLTELKLGTEVSGLHNWIYFNAEEIKKRLDYLGYIKKVDLGNKAAIVKAHVRFNGIDKPVTNIFVGTSPELEMALYTVCFLVRPEAPCPVSLGGTKFNIITHKFRYRGRDLIGSAYPEI